LQLVKASILEQAAFGALAEALIAPTRALMLLV